MNERPPEEESADELDELYRQASSRDESAPSESVRRAVLRHAADLARDRSAKGGPVEIDFRQPAANQAWRRPAAYGGLAAAVLAGLLIAPRFIPPSPAPSADLGAAHTAASATVEAAPPAQAPSDAQLSRAFSEPELSELAHHEGPRAAAKPRAERDRSSGGENRSQGLSAGMPTARSPAENSASAGRAAGVIDADKSDALALQKMMREGATAQSSKSQAAAAAAPRLDAPLSALAAPARSMDSAAALRDAAALGNVARLRALMSEQSDLDARDSDGRSALMLAVQNGRVDAVEALLKSGADANAADFGGTTPLAWAHSHNQSAIAELLRRAGAR